MRTCQTTATDEIGRRRGKLVGHTLGKPGAQHRQTGSNLGPTGEEGQRPAQEYLAETSPGRHQEHGTQLVGG